MYRLKKSEIDKVCCLYEERLKNFGYHYKSLGWGSWHDQHLRFRILSEIGNLDNSFIVDVGCGFGDLYPYLRKRFKHIRYLGIDLSVELVKKAKELYSKSGAKFSVANILDSSFKKKADYYLLSGALNFRLRENLELAKNTLEKMFYLSRKAVACNFLSKYVDYEAEKNFHYHPEEIFAFGKKLTKYVSLRHDYPLWEFTIYLYKRKNDEPK